MGVPGGSEVNPPANAGDVGSILGSGRFPWRRKWQPTPVFLLGKFYGPRSLVGYSSRGCKESDATEHTHTHTHTRDRFWEQETTPKTIAL